MGQLSVSFYTYVGILLIDILLNNGTQTSRSEILNTVQDYLQNYMYEWSEIFSCSKAQVISWQPEFRPALCARGLSRLNY
jgi:hypothetical protein